VGGEQIATISHCKSFGPQSVVERTTRLGLWSYDGTSFTAIVGRMISSTYVLSLSRANSCTMKALSGIHEEMMILYAPYPIRAVLPVTTEPFTSSSHRPTVRLSSSWGKRCSKECAQYLTESWAHSSFLPMSISGLQLVIIALFVAVATFLLGDLKR